MTVLIEFATGEKFANYAGPGIDRGLKSFSYDRGMACYSITGTLGVYQSKYSMRVTNSDGRFDSAALRESWRGVRVEVRKNGVLHTVCHVRKAVASEGYLDVEFDGLTKQLDKIVCNIYDETIPFQQTRGKVRRAVFGAVYSCVYPYSHSEAGARIDFDFGDSPVLLTGGASALFRNNLGYAPADYELSPVTNGWRVTTDSSTTEQIEQSKYGAIYSNDGGGTINNMWTSLCTRADATDYAATISGHPSYGLNGTFGGGYVVTDLTTTYADVAARIGASLDCALVERNGLMMFVGLGALIDAPYVRSIGREIKLGVNEGEIVPVGMSNRYEDYTNEGFLDGKDLVDGNDGPFKYESTIYTATGTPPHVSYLTPDYYKRITPSVIFGGSGQQPVFDMQSALRQQPPRIIECQLLDSHDLSPGDGVRATYPRFDIGAESPWLVLSQSGDLLQQAAKFILYRTIEGELPE